MPANVTKFGPGTITVGTVPTDFSAQLINAMVEWDEDKDDDVTVLSGDVVPGAITYTATITGALFQDLTASGIVAYSWDNMGTTQPFEFTPNTAATASVAGQLTISPISIGSDEPKANMQSDFTWNIVGIPTFTPGALAAAAAEAEPQGSSAAA